MSRIPVAAIYLGMMVLVLTGHSEAVSAPGFRPVFTHLTVDDGLPENTVRCVIQDQVGFLWLGTQSGLTRYDGYEMITPWHPAMPRFMVTALLEDAEGAIWIGTVLNGLWRLDPRTERSTQVVAPEDVPARGAVLNVGGLGLDRRGWIWVAWSTAGLCRVDPHSLAVVWIGQEDATTEQAGGLVDEAVRDQAASLVPAPPSSQLNDVLHDDHGRIWLATNDIGLLMWEPGETRWTGYRHDPDRSDSLPADTVVSLTRTPDGRIWILTVRGIATWHQQRGKLQVFIPRPDGLPMHNYCLAAVADGAGGLWLGSAAGLYHVDAAAGRFELHAHDPRDPRSPVKGPVLSVCRDRAGVIWAGSWHAGLNKLDPAAQKFRYFDHDPADPSSLDDDSVAAILESADGTLWVGTGSMATGGSIGSLNELAPGATCFVHHEFPDEFVRTVQALAEDHDGQLWLGTNRGLWRFDGTAGRPVRDQRGPTGAADIDDVAVRSLHSDSAGNLWVGTIGGGVYRIAPGGTRSDRFQVGGSEDGFAVALATPVVIHEDRRRRIWIGTDSLGLYRFDDDTATFEAFFDPRVGLSSVIDIHEDGAGFLWLGTYGGLLQFDPDAEIVVRSVGIDEGLPHNVISSILADDRGDLWLSTGRGICRFDARTGQVQAYDARDGLPSNELAFARIRRRDGTLVFGNAGGLIPFRPETIIPRRDDPRVVLTSLRIVGEPIGPVGSNLVDVAAPYLNAIVLPHDLNDLSVSFATLHFAHPERNRYRYRLLGDDATWRDASRQRTATYTNLVPGRYRFEVLGSNGDGFWSTTAAGLDIVIRPPWWQMSWAWALYLALVGLLALLVYRHLVQRERVRAALAVERAEAQQLQELAGFKTRFFANITHEFRTPLTLLRGPVQRLREDPAGGDVELFAMMARNIERLGKLIDQLLDLSRLDARSLLLRFTEADCVGFLRDFAASFDSLVRSRDLRYEIELPPTPARGWFDGDLLEKVVGNLLTNAVKFAPAGASVRLELTVDSHVNERDVPGGSELGQARQRVPARDLHLTVANTGSFIPADQLERVFDRFHQLPAKRPTGGSGIGLALVRELVSWHGGKVSAFSDPDKGTRFLITIPLFLEPPTSADSLETDAGGGRADGEPTADAAAVAADAPLVLVVEDHVDLRAYLARELSPTYRLLLAEDGAAGLELALAEIPDLVVSDVMMPRLDGFELCQALRQDDRTCHVPVILLTALAEIEKRREGLRHGADAYLAKPFDVEELVIRVENLIEQRRCMAAVYADRVVRLAPAAMPVVSADDRFLQRTREVIEEHLDDVDLQVEVVCRAVALSRSHFHRKLKALTNQSATAFIRAHRLQRAADLLAGGYGNVTEVAFAVGFQSLSYFARCFREQYGVAPSEYSRRER